MLPILLVLGATGALLEIKRLVGRPPKDGDLFKLQQSEEHLKRVLQEIQRELQQERSEHEHDQAKINELEDADLQLRRAHADILACKEQEIRQRALEFNQLSDKVEELRIQHEEENRIRDLKFESEVDLLKHDISDVFEQFSEGKIGAEALLKKVSDMGVEVQLTAEELKHAVATASEVVAGRRQSKQLQLQVDSEWRSQLRLLSDDPERLARQLAEGAHRATLPALGSSSSSFPTVKTPKERKEANLFSNLPSLALPSFSSSNPVDKENASEGSRKGALKAPAAEPLQAVPPNRCPEGVIPIESKKVASPTKSKKRPHVPRLGLAMALKNSSSSRSSRDHFALGDLSNDDDEHRMLNRSIM